MRSEKEVKKRLKEMEEFYEKCCMHRWHMLAIKTLGVIEVLKWVLEK